MGGGACYTPGMGDTQVDNPLRTAIPLPMDGIAEFCRKWDVPLFELYGPVLTDDFGADDEVDVMVTFGPDARWSLYDWVHMIDDLTVLFGRKASLITRSTAEQNQYPHRHERMLAEARVVYAR